MKSYTAFYCAKQIKAFLPLPAQAGVGGSELCSPLRDVKETLGPPPPKNQSSKTTIQEDNVLTF